MLYREMIAVYSEIYTKKNSLWAERGTFNVKSCGTHINHWVFNG